MQKCVFLNLLITMKLCSEEKLQKQKQQEEEELPKKKDEAVAETKAPKAVKSKS